MGQRLFFSLRLGLNVNLNLVIRECSELEESRFIRLFYDSVMEFYVNFPREEYQWSLWVRFNVLSSDKILLCKANKLSTVLYSKETSLRHFSEDTVTLHANRPPKAKACHNHNVCTFLHCLNIFLLFTTASIEHLHCFSLPPPLLLAYYIQSSCMSPFALSGSHKIC